jgi:hypothetical protein
MGIGNQPIAPPHRGKIAHAERLIGSIRRKCLVHIVILGEDHLRRVLKTMLPTTTGSERTYPLGKDAPTHRTIQRLGQLVARPILIEDLFLIQQRLWAMLADANWLVAHAYPHMSHLGNEGTGHGESIDATGTGTHSMPANAS